MADLKSGGVDDLKPVLVMLMLACTLIAGSVIVVVKKNPFWTPAPIPTLECRQASDEKAKMFAELVKLADETKQRLEDVYVDNDYVIEVLKRRVHAVCK